MFNILELFSGAGGLALGMHKAGFKPIALVDMYKDANDTIKANNPEWNVITEDINIMADKGIFSYIDRTRVDALSGGFPCQPFSYAGKRLGLEDTRGIVFYSLTRIIEEVSPKVILLENVKGLETHDQGKTFKTILKSLDEIGYKIDYRILNSWNYNVAQKRQRLIIIGVKKEFNSKYSWPEEIEPKPVLKDVLKDVAKSPGQTYPDKKKKVLDLVPPGGCWIDLPDEIAREYMGKSYFSGGGKRGMARRISWEEPSLTLTTSPAQKQTERCHPEETRPFTIREYARIQSFPDNYEFKGSISSQYKQIGNAVPVNLAYYIGIELKKLLKRIEEEN